MVDSLARYADRFSADRQATRVAIEDVWNHVPEAQEAFSSINVFSRAAVAQRSVTKKNVILAQLCMKVGGYETDGYSDRGGLRWKKRRRG